MTHENEGEQLVELARGAVVHALGGPAPNAPIGAWFEQPAATFVTITRRGVLHGCIGSVTPRRSLAADVEHNALAAAFSDPRSERFRAEWLPEMGVEVTLLSPLERLTFADEAEVLRQIVPGVDGLVLKWETSQATFLPQVWETLPDRGTFLDALKVKAGLPRSFWSEGVDLYRFRVQKWGDRRAALRVERATS